jgi:hypothetical protein
MIAVAGRRGRKHKQLLNDLAKMRGYHKLIKETLDRTLWRTGIAISCRPVVRQTIEWLKFV